MGEQCRRAPSGGLQAHKNNRYTCKQICAQIVCIHTDKYVCVRNPTQHMAFKAQRCWPHRSQYHLRRILGRHQSTVDLQDAACIAANIHSQLTSLGICQAGPGQNLLGGFRVYQCQWAWAAKTAVLPCLQAVLLAALPDNPRLQELHAD